MSAMQRIFAPAGMMVLALSLAACGGHDDSQAGPPADNSPTAVENSTESDPESMPSPEEETTSESPLSLTGSGTHTSSEGYVVNFDVAYVGGEPVVDVADNPPGIVNVVVEAPTSEVTITNVTEGGRDMPMRAVNSLTVVGMYAEDSPACSAQRNNPSFTVPDPTARGRLPGGGCWFDLAPLISDWRAGAVPDPIPYGSSVTLTYDDLVISASEAPGLTLTRVFEDDADGLTTALATPDAMGLATWYLDAKPELNLDGQLCTLAGDAEGIVDYEISVSSESVNPSIFCG